MVLIVEGHKAQEEDLPADALRTLALLQAELPLKKAAALAAEIHGVKKMRCISMRWSSRRVITGVAAGIALQRL